MSNKTGGPAFPRPASADPLFDARCQAQTGMTLRDYFAAKAMQGWIVSNVEASNKQFAEAAYEMADAMLAERGKVNE